MRNPHKTTRADNAIPYRDGPIECGIRGVPCLYFAPDVVERIGDVEISICNCAGCGRPLLGERCQRALEKCGYLPWASDYLPDIIGTGVEVRPYCAPACTIEPKSWGLRPQFGGVYGGPASDDSENPWLQTRIRMMEDLDAILNPVGG